MRHAMFTSSEIWTLTTSGKQAGTLGQKAITYIKKRINQARWGKSFISGGSMATKWGNFFEPYAIARYVQETGIHVISYSDHKKDFKVGPLPNHGGTPDFTTFDETVVGSVKCPQEDAFIDLFDLIKSKDIERFKEDHKEYYWQLISDLIVTGARYCVFVIYMPYEDEVADLLSDSELYWLTEPACVKRGTEFTDLAYWQFQPPIEDVEFLTSRIEMASDLLSKTTQTLIASPIPEGVLIEKA